MSESFGRIEQFREGSFEEPRDLPALDIRVGGFLNELSDIAVPGEVIVPINLTSGKAMSPIEASTGIPLPIVGRFAKNPNRHHSFFYGRNYLEGSIGQQAVRHSRMQRVGQYVHSQYHRKFDGTAFPDSKKEEYEITVLNCAGYIPEYGVKIAKKQPIISRLTSKERKLLRREGAFLQENGATITKFLLDYALEQNFDEDEQLHIEEFIELTPKIVAHSKEMQIRKLRLAERLTHKAIGVAVDPINPIYKEARKERKLRNGTPSSAWEVVRDKVRWKIPQYMERLEDKIIAEFG